MINNGNCPSIPSHKPRMIYWDWLVLLVVVLIVGVLPLRCNAQNMPFPPPNQMQVYSIQQLSFGSFFPGNSGGSVIMSPSGMRSSTGSVVLAGGSYFQAIFEIRLIPGRLIQIQLGPTATLTRSGGGGSMIMAVGPTNRGSSFVTTGGHPFRNIVNVGGELFVGNISANPAGNYEGLFSITFIQE